MTDAPPPAPPDLAQLVLAFARLVEVYLRERRPGPAGAVAVRARPDGVLEARFASAPPDVPAALLELLPAPDAARDCREAGPFGWSAPVGESTPARDAARDALEAACERLAKDPRFGPLHVANAGLESLRLDTGTVDVLLARRLDTGRSRVAGFRFAAAEEDPGPSYRLVFGAERDEGRVAFTLAPPEVRPEGSFAAAGPFRLDVQVQEADGPARDLAPGDDATLPAATRALVDFVRFLLARALPPGLALSWEGFKGRAQAGSGPGEGSPLQTSNWTQKTAWRRFFVPFEAERDLMRGFASQDAWGRTIFFLHGESECRHIQPMGADRASYHRPLRPASTDRRIEEESPAVRAALVEALGPDAFAAKPLGRPADDATAEEEAETHPTVLLGEQEVIFGATEQLSDSLRNQRRRARTGDVFFFNETCVAKLMGEDLQRVKREHLAAGGAPILELNIQLNSPLEMLRDFVSQMRTLLLSQSTLEQAGGVIEDGVALVGYPEDGSVPELAALLAGLGLRLTTAFLPALGRESLMDALRSRYLVCHPGGGWKEMAESLLAGPHTTILAPNLPFGLDGTFRFLDAVAAATGRADRAAAARPALDALSAHLRHPLPRPLGLGYVVDPVELRRLALASGPFGIPSLPFLHGLGFGQAVFLGVPVDRPPSDDERALVDRASGAPGSVALATFVTLDELRDRVAAADDVQAVYSQFTFDRRLYACGKAAFSMADLECGLWGALRTARRLARRCLWEGPRRFGTAVAERGWNA